MWIKAARIRNYKSFDDSDWLEFDRHMNVVVGANHSGKSALLNAISSPASSGRLRGIPHNNSGIRRGTPLNPASGVDFRYCVSGQELEDAILANGLNAYIPLPLSWAHSSSREQVMRRFFDLAEIVLSVQRQSFANGSYHWVRAEYPSTNLFTDEGDRAFLNVSAKADRSGIHVAQMASGENDNLAENCCPILEKNVYFFDAQRVPQSDVPFGSSSTLSPNASNLAEVLSTMQPNRTEFAEYVAQVSRVIPSIKWISVTPSTNQSQNVQVRIWNVPDSTKRDDLAIPLAECGTGVGQVLSILYVVMKSRGSIVIIDEPNSFLHPRAAKALVGILREDHSNQYVISTHSPEIITSSDPNRFFLLKFADEKTRIHEISRADLASTKQVLSEIGAQLSDVFGADNVLWVEGPTEVQCFPLLLSAAGRALNSALTVAPLRSTGDLESRHGKVVADIYRNLSSAHTILPTTVAVSLDGDKRDMKDKDNLERAFGSVLRFLSRRCYENYLIHPEGICATLNETSSFATSPLKPEQITDWIKANAGNGAYRSGETDVFSSGWFETVDAPALLEDIFQEISESREIFRKPLHSVAITRWLIENDRSFLQELLDYVASLVPNEPQER